MTLDIDAGDLLAELVRALEQRPELASRLRAVLVPAPNDEPVYLPVAVWAARAGISERTAWAWVRDGLPTVQAGRVRRVDVRRADEWLRERTRPDVEVERRARQDAERSARKAIA